MAARPIRAVFFDAGNTLFTERRSRVSLFASVARQFGGRAGEEESASALFRTLAELPASINGNFRFSHAWFETFNQKVMEELEVPADKRWLAHLDLAARFENPRSYRVFPEVPKILDQLLNLGVTVGVVSNWSERLPQLLAGLNLANKFHFVVTSAEMRCEKPDRAIFERALFRAGVPAAEALHVGDHLKRDVLGALGAGLRAAHLDRGAAPGCTPDGVPILPDLREIPRLMEQSSYASRP